MTDSDWGQFVGSGNDASAAAPTAGEAVEAALGETIHHSDPGTPTEDDSTAQTQQEPASADATAPTHHDPSAADDAAAAPTASAHDPSAAADDTAQVHHDPSAVDTGAAASTGDSGTAASDGQPAPDGQTQPDQAATWEEWGQTSLATAAVMEEVASEHLQAAAEWASYGNVEAAQEELLEAQVATELGAESAAIASAEFELAAEYHEHVGDPSGSGSDGDPSAANQTEASGGAADSYDSGSSDDASAEPEHNQE
jgi:hypothetical protein